jgi:hypothetical protein
MSSPAHHHLGCRPTRGRGHLSSRPFGSCVSGRTACSVIDRSQRWIGISCRHGAGPAAEASSQRVATYRSARDRLRRSAAGSNGAKALESCGYCPTTRTACRRIAPQGRGTHGGGRP